MAKREDIKKVLIIGSGPIIIGQACEFDYSGTQACKALRGLGYEVVLANSNPATIMTDPGMADHTYIEPLTVDSIEKIIAKERPDALLPNLGGQTALNLAISLQDNGILDKYNVQVIGVDLNAIKRGEDRIIFKETMNQLGVPMAKSEPCYTVEEAEKIANELGYPVVLRPAYTMGGTGGGIVYNVEELREVVARGLAASLINQVLVEECALGWEELELEVVRDAKGDKITVCFIENVDPMGVHTGDSFCVAPMLTVPEEVQQRLQDYAYRIIDAVGVIGGCNVQFAHNREDGRIIVIEINPRTSRSSALASKATGFPIASVSTKLAAGITLDELPYWRDGSLEKYTPSGDYVVVKFARWAFEKFPQAQDRLGTQMKAVGEVMSIGKNFKEALQKAIRSLEIGRAGLGMVKKIEKLSLEELRPLVASPSSERFFHLYEAFKKGLTVDEACALTRITRYFLQEIKELADFELKLAAYTWMALPDELLVQAKKFGFSDKYLAKLFSVSEKEVRECRLELGCAATFCLVPVSGVENADYYYSTYSGAPDEVPVSSNRKIMVLGGGPNRIGQGIEFDYCCCHAAFALRKAGYEVVMVNSNPETVSTDYDTSDKLYFEPLTLEDVMHIYERESCSGVIVQFGGQTPLNLAQQLKAAGANVIGTAPDDIDAAEDRDFFKQLAARIGIRQPESGIAHSVEEAVEIAEKIGYPLLVRPSFVLGGRGMVIVYKEKYLRKFVEEAAAVAEGKPILIDRFLEDATELDVDCISDGKTTVIGAILEHVEPAGIHSGDSASVIPPMTLPEAQQEKVRDYARAFARELRVCGLMNMQLAVKDDEIYIIEVNPRASRTVPFVSKATGVPLAGLAARCMAGESLEAMGFTKEVHIPYTAVKEAVFPFVKFPGVDIVLSPEMKSTGEVMSLDRERGLAYLKSQLAAGNRLPASGNVFISLRDEDKPKAVRLAEKLVKLGYNLYATLGTSTLLYNAGIKTRAVFRISRGRPNLLDLIREKEIQWIINSTESGAEAMVDEIRMRSQSVVSGIPITTTIAGLTAAIEGLTDKADFGRFEVCSLQEYHRHIR